MEDAARLLVVTMFFKKMSHFRILLLVLYCTGDVNSLQDSYYPGKNLYPRESYNWFSSLQNPGYPNNYVYHWPYVLRNYDQHVPPNYASTDLYRQHSPKGYLRQNYLQNSPLYRSRIKEDGQKNESIAPVNLIKKDQNIGTNLQNKDKSECKCPQCPPLQSTSSPPNPTSQQTNTSIPPLQWSPPTTYSPSPSDVTFQSISTPNPTFPSSPSSLTITTLQSSPPTTYPPTPNTSPPNYPSFQSSQPPVNTNSIIPSLQPSTPAIPNNGTAKSTPPPNYPSFQPSQPPIYSTPVNPSIQSSTPVTYPPSSINRTFQTTAPPNYPSFHPTHPPIYSNAVDPSRESSSPPPPPNYPPVQASLLPNYPTSPPNPPFQPSSPPSYPPSQPPLLQNYPNSNNPPLYVTSQFISPPNPSFQPSPPLPSPPSPNNGAFQTPPNYPSYQPTQPPIYSNAINPSLESFMPPVYQSSITNGAFQPSSPPSQPSLLPNYPSSNNPPLESITISSYPNPVYETSQITSPPNLSFQPSPPPDYFNPIQLSPPSPNNEAFPPNYSPLQSFPFPDYLNPIDPLLQPWESPNYENPISLLDYPPFQPSLLPNNPSLIDPSYGIFQSNSPPDFPQFPPSNYPNFINNPVQQSVSSNYLNPVPETLQPLPALDFPLSQPSVVSGFSSSVNPPLEPIPLPTYPSSVYRAIKLIPAASHSLVHPVPTPISPNPINRSLLELSNYSRPTPVSWIPSKQIFGKVIFKPVEDLAEHQIIIIPKPKVYKNSTYRTLHSNYLPSKSISVSNYPGSFRSLPPLDQSSLTHKIIQPSSPPNYSWIVYNSSGPSVYQNQKVNQGYSYFYSKPLSTVTYGSPLLAFLRKTTQ